MPPHPKFREVDGTLEVYTCRFTLWGWFPFDTLGFYNQELWAALAECVCRDAEHRESSAVEEPNEWYQATLAAEAWRAVRLAARAEQETK